MFDALSNSAFMPHGHCYLWQPALLWSHVSSDAIIALAYFSIPLTILYFVSKRKGLTFGWVGYLFAAFIVLCGITHIMGIVTVWKPVYPLEAVIKFATAVVSIFTAAAIIPTVPRLLSLRTPEELEAVNLRLQSEIESRREVEDELRDTIRKLEEANAEYQQFAYSASHDLQAPLRSISGFAELLQEDHAEQLDADGREYLGIIKDSTDRMQALIRGLLALSRLSNALDVAPIADTRALVDTALANLQADIRDSKAEIDIGELPAVHADASQIAQLFQNLIGNAIKYQQPDTVPQITINGHRSGAECHFSIRDNGIGIDPRYQDRIFKIFQRLHAADEYEGAGIGLALCAKIVQRHGGRIWVDSAAGEGSCFHFTLAPPQAASQAPRKDLPNPGPAAGLAPA